MEDLQLYSYQEEVAQRAVLGENVIIWLPTGGGKTRAAVYVAKRHLETNPTAKVVVIVNMVHLVDQHYKNEFSKYLEPQYQVLPVSGDSDEKDFFGKVLKTAHVVVCTAQILYNAMINEDEDRHAELSDITLLIVDECHHTHKDHVYNKIMRCYVEKKLNNEGPLPQVLGLTASPGTGNKKVLEEATEHVLTICANLDSAIVSTQNYRQDLQQKVPRPRKVFDITEKRPKDPFGDHIKWMMLQIHEFMDLPRDVHLRECGTQEYEQDVVLLEQRGVRENNRMIAQCALHLREYNDALLINDTLRMIDAYNSLKSFYSNKTTMDTTDIWLVGLFEENEVELRLLAQDPSCENPKMAKLESTLLKQFEADKMSKGILFTKTRRSVHCLHEWILGNVVLRRAGIKAATLIGAGNGLSHMTQNAQKETIREFRGKALNLLISTTVAEEGLDIPECNVVVRYGLLTNDIAQQQASGRARAQDSVYSVVAQRGGRELRRELINEHLEELTKKAVAKVQEMSNYDFKQKIRQLQREELIRQKLAERKNEARRNRFTATNVQLVCRNCLKSVARGSDLRLVEGAHYVNINPQFKREYKVGGAVVLERDFEDWEPGCKIICNNGNCNKDWGFEMKYKGVAILGTLKISSFALLTPEGQITVKKWKDIPFPVGDFDFVRYCEDHHPDLLA
ncbi:probable ATP-dependent RNA helicase DHX58 [Periophthalmus magnuspinnatus]|uniref:probable ATP-dependent RNA helicase DHX58 n=1 Tax=Periophthalmus magnuspinnatus TaxID=409849 RepID=UPI00145A63F8|nr:probable ATP-dependent RNA helicase DHX58 [Periophthalmus magnuspinnatus]XP_033827296.1 probable ATP-dependent RNA helicase DHX58 [Periophthalmus magnuspinnatus]